MFAWRIVTGIFRFRQPLTGAKSVRRRRSNREEWAGHLTLHKSRIVTAFGLFAALDDSASERSFVIVATEEHWRIEVDFA